MRLLCKLGWHRWDEQEVFVRFVMMKPKSPPGYIKLERQCERSGKLQVYSPGLHHPPYWKPPTR